MPAVVFVPLPRVCRHALLCNHKRNGPELLPPVLLLLLAQVVGENELAARLMESEATIRRDIMFAASLYL
jgi:hypothetical protein